MRATFVRSEVISPGITTYYFQTDQKLRYDAGQFIELTIEHNADNRGVRRWFTLSSSPTESEIAVTTRSSDARSTFKLALSSLRRGDYVLVSQAMGDFILPKSESLQLIFVAAGIGITPFRSMIKYLSDSGQNRQIKMLATNSEGTQLPFYELLHKQLKNDLVFKSARTDAKEILRLYPPTETTLYFIAGPEPFVETIVLDLGNAGVANHQIIADYFPNYPA